MERRSGRHTVLAVCTTSSLRGGNELGRSVSSLLTVVEGLTVNAMSQRRGALTFWDYAHLSCVQGRHLAGCTDPRLAG